MKVSIVDPVGGHGGMDYYDYGLAQGLGGNNLDVNYYTCDKTNVRFYKNVQTNTVFGNLWEKKGVFKLFAFLNAYLKAFKSAKRNKSEVLHFQFFSLGNLNLIVLSLAYWFKQKKIVTLHDIESFHKGNSKLVSKLCLKLIEGIILHNQFSKTEFEKLFNFKGDIEIIPHGNYLPFIKPQTLDHIAPTINLLFFGQIKEVKGLDILLKAMAEVVKTSNNYHLTIAGRPWKTEGKDYENKIKKLGLSKNVTTHFKYIKDEDVEQFYKNADIVVMPYKKIYQSGVLLLSLSYGRTVIVSNLTPFTAVVTHNKNGFVFKSEDSSDLAICILGLNKEKIRKVTSKSKELIEDKYDWLKIGLKTKKFYNSL
jgi:D-inositol-3-phosphate glycosyltransferase